jgi:hypothetical protein
MKTAMMIALSLLTGCNGPRVVQTGETARDEMEQTEANQARLAKATAVPKFDQSLERENLVRRLQNFNVANKIGYVYLLGNQGQVIAFYTIKGKVSSMNSLLTNPQQVIQVKKGTMSDPHVEVVPSPDLDGSYGHNPEGIFFFTTSGAMIETTLNFIYTDQPLKITTPITLIETTK